MSWRPPVDDGGDPVSGYTLDLLENGSDVIASLHLGNATSYTAEDLVAGQSYQISVAAVNSYGASPAGLSELVKLGE